MEQEKLIFGWKNFF